MISAMYYIRTNIYITYHKEADSRKRMRQREVLHKRPLYVVWRSRPLPFFKRRLGVAISCTACKKKEVVIDRTKSRTLLDIRKIQPAGELCIQKEDLTGDKRTCGSPRVTGVEAAFSDIKDTLGN